MFNVPLLDNVSWRIIKIEKLDIIPYAFLLMKSFVKKYQFSSNKLNIEHFS